MTGHVHRCIAGCGRVVTWQFALCKDCEKIYGSSAYMWPEWLRFLWADIQRERRRQHRIAKTEVSLEDHFTRGPVKGRRKPGAE